MRRGRLVAGLVVVALLVLLVSRVRFVAPGAKPPVATAPPPSGRAPAAGDTTLRIPVQGVAATALHDDWGQPRGDGDREHHAIDILAPKGTPVLAAASGTVEKRFESALGGHTLYVRTPDGATVHYYAHLDTIGVPEGASVRQGQPIATVGDSGSAAGGPPHLHFEIKQMRPGEGWWQGTNIDPYPLLAGKPGRS
ncbi:M23 family metallopeptidase [Sphingomonas sp. R1]|uniref:M23 family metallopeptidase n=1 Tax=Sphingomonas sp. R1 TaxID=399176 RepID=UPI00222486C9|nr:M23 family metallopeptidase [Sphingomonas sp. R1]UYY78262.1 M23 family metallopeptidase [Sphingomonas sp. R1]